MLIKINCNIKEVFQAFGVKDKSGNPLKFKNSIKYVELDTENAEKLKNLNLEELYKGKIKIEYNVEVKDRKKDEAELEKIKTKDEMTETLKEEMQELSETLSEMTVADITGEYKKYISSEAKGKEAIIKSIVENLYKEKLAEIEKELA
jgi:hypothetical protein